MTLEDMIVAVKMGANNGRSRVTDPSWKETYEVEQMSIEVPISSQRGESNRPALCGHRGPFTVAKPGKYKTVYLTLTCTRPHAHDGNHQHADARRGPSHEWDDKWYVCPQPPAPTAGGQRGEQSEH